MIQKLSFIWSIVIIITTINQGSSKIFAQDNSQELNTLLNNAFSAIQSNPTQAIRLFEQAEAIDPSNILIKKQLGFLYIDQNQNERALEKFLQVDRLSPSDTVKLQIAYLLNSLQRNFEAYHYFKLVENSRDPDICAKARTAVVVLESEIRVQDFPFWGNIYVAPYYDTRWKSYFGMLQFNEGFYFDRSKIFSLFGTVRMSGDSKSKEGTPGTAPILFSDNVIIFDGGIKIRPFYGLSAEILGGIGVDIIKEGSSKRVREDFRAIVTYGNGIYPSISTPKILEFTLKPFADAYTSFGYYSRYKNAIGYGSTRAGLRVIEWKKSAVDLYGRFDISRDTEKKFYNNLVEWGGGIQFIPHYSFGLIFVAEYHRGRYWRVSDVVLPYDLYYNSYRFFIIFERAL